MIILRDVAQKKCCIYVRNWIYQTEIKQNKFMSYEK